MAGEPGIDADQLVPADGGELGGANRHFNARTGKLAQLGLTQQVQIREKLWPTPCANEAQHDPEKWAERARKKLGQGINLRFPLGVAVNCAKFPTPLPEGTHCRGKAGPSLGYAAKHGKWPTPRANAAMGQTLTEKVAHRKGARPWMELEVAVARRMWPTPGRIDSDFCGMLPETCRNRRAEGKQETLATVVQAEAFPSPRASDSKGTGPRGSKSQAYDEAKGHLTGTVATAESGQLNPDWVEWLMGWPVGWTSLAPMPSGRILPWSEEPADVPRVAPGVERRSSRLKAIGNGQVPACAAAAFALLTADKTGDAAV